jgi:hypothetical protein
LTVLGVGSGVVVIVVAAAVVLVVLMLTLSLHGRRKATERRIADQRHLDEADGRAARTEHEREVAEAEMPADQLRPPA